MKSLFTFSPYKSISLYVVLLAVGALLYSSLTFKKWEGRRVIEWDVVSYYAYLPAAFIHHDIALGFYGTDGVNYPEKHEFWPEIAENGGKVIKTTMGMAILYSPFFALGHIIAQSSGYTPDGFSLPYHVCIHFACLFYLLIGFFYLRALLLKLFTEKVTAFVIVITAIGTNLYIYSTFDSAMSHPFNFSLIAIFLYYSLTWHEKTTLFNSFMIGVIGGLIILIRPVNILIFIFPLFLYVSTYKDISTKIHFFWERKWYILFITLCIFLMVLPQLLYWKYVTGHFFFNSYVGESFFFNNPHILEGLFSYRKGWLVYTPVMIFAVLGFYSLYKTQRAFFLATFLFLLVTCYVIFSWWSWWYGGGFGMRPMIDFYALLAIPMAAFFQQCFALKNLLFKYILVQVVCVLIWINIIQTRQVIGFTIHYDSMTKDAYWMHFLKLECIDWGAFEKALHSPDYVKALKGEDEYEFNPF
ncbi:MAG: hypothetical protein JWO58_164 [Chitinophagaceae bacterium]|nr:hypothetical protein [Chitinophagaceae bacterium]